MNAIAWIKKGSAYDPEHMMAKHDGGSVMT